MNELPESTMLRMRLRADDTHYAGGVIPASTYMKLMADAGALLGLMRGESAGYLARWEAVDFTSVCYVGDYIEIQCRLLEVGNRSRRMEFEVHKLIRTGEARTGQTTKGVVLDPPELVAKGIYIGVIPRADLDSDSRQTVEPL